MPAYLVELDDGRKFRVEADAPPSPEDVLSYLEVPAQPEPEQPGRLGSFASSVGRGALSVVPGTIGGIGYLTGQEGLVETAEDIEGGINRMLPVNPAYENEFLMKAGGALGQAGGMLLTGGVTGAAGKALAASRGLTQQAAKAAGTQLARNVLTGTGVLQGARGGGQAAEQYGMQGGTAYARALLGGAIEGLSERALFGMGTELAPVKKFLGDAAEKGVGGIAKAAGTEAGEEAAAQIGGNLATSVLAPYGVQTPGAFEGAGEAALLGGIAGGALGGVNALMQPSPTIEGEAMIPAEVPVAPEQPETDEFGIEAFRQEMAEIAQNPDPSVPLQTAVNKTAEASVMQNADVLPATAAVIEAGGLAPTPVQEETPVGAPVEEQPASGVLLPQDTAVETEKLPVANEASLKAHESKFLTPDGRRFVPGGFEQYSATPYGRDATTGLPVFAGDKKYRPTNITYFEDGGIHKNVLLSGAEYSVMIAKDGGIHFGPRAGLGIGEKAEGGAFATMNAIGPHLRELIEAKLRANPTQVFSINANSAKKLPLFLRYAKNAGFKVEGNSFTVPSAPQAAPVEAPPTREELYARLRAALATQPAEQETDLEQPEPEPPVVEETIAPIQPVPAVEEATAAEITPEQVQNVENVIDEPGAAEVGLGMENTPTTDGTLEKGTEIEYEGEVLKVVGYEDDGRLVVSNRTGGWKNLPPNTQVKVLPKIENLFASLVKGVEEGFDFYDRLNIQAAPKTAETIPSGDLPRGTHYFRTDTKGAGQPGGSSYAITPEGLLYDDSGRSMTHGGVSPYRLIGKATPQSLASRLRAATSRAEAESLLDSAKLDEVKAAAVEMGYSAKGSKKDISRALISAVGSRVDAIAIRNAGITPVKPTVAPTQGAGTLSSGQRDTSKPEQMVPITVNVIGGGTVEVQVPQKWDAELGQYVLSPEADEIINESKWPKSFSSPFHPDYATRDEDSYFGIWGIQGDEQNRKQTSKNYKELLELAVRARKPVSKEGWKFDLRNPIPQGYVQDGELYVYRPSGTVEADPATKAEKVKFVHTTKTEPGKGQNSGYYPGTYAYEKENGMLPVTEGTKFTGELQESEIYTLENADQLKKDASEAGFGYHSGNGNAEVEYLKSEGFKAIRRGSTGGVEIIVFDAKDAGFTPQAPKAKPMNMAGEIRPERAKPKPTPEFETLHPKTQEKFNAAFEAKDAGAMNALLDPMNRGSRAEFEKRTDTKLPTTQKGTRGVVETWAATTPVADLTDAELDRDLLRLGEYAQRSYASDSLKARTLALAKEFQKRQAPQPKPAAEVETPVAGVPAELPDPATLTNAQINKEKAALTKKRDSITDRMIAADRGSELSSETLKKTDPLSKEFQEVTRRFQDLSNEAEMRMGSRVYGDLPTDKSWKSYRRKKPEDFGSSNTLAPTPEGERAARKRLSKAIRGKTNIGGMLDPSILKDAIAIGAFYIEGGARRFAEFSAKMIEEFGAGIQKYIRPAYEALRKRTDIDTTGMDPEEGAAPKPKGDITLNPSEIEVIPEDMARAEQDKKENNERWQKASVSTEPVSVLRRLDGTYKMIDGHHRLLGAMDRGETIEAKVTQEKKLEPLKKAEQEAPAPVASAEPATVPIANDPVDAQRLALGLPPIMRQTQEAYTFPQMWSDAEAAMTANPKRGEALVTELNSTPRTISALEDAILLRERVNRVNALDLAMVEFNKAPKGNNEMQRRAMDDAITSLTELDDALNVAGTEQGRSLNARKMLAKLDYTLPKMLTTLRAANEGDLSEADVAMVTRLQKQLAETQKKLAEAEKRQSEFSQERFDEVAAAAKEEGRKEALREIEEKAQVQAAKVAELTKRKAEFQEAKKKPGVLDEILKAAEARIASRRGKLYSDVLMLNAAADAADYVLIGAVKIAKGITKFADWVASMKESDPSLADDQMEQLFKEAKAFHDGEVQTAETPLKTRKAKAPVIDKVKAIATDGEELDSRTIYNFVVEKVKERSAKTPKAEMTDKDLASVIQEVTKDVQQFFPNITEREIRDLFSGYGKSLMPSQDELSKQVRQLSALGKLVSAIEDAKAQRAPLKSGPQRDKATQAIRLKQKELARALRMNGVEYAADEEQLRSPLDAIKARLNNQINDLALEINTRKKTPRRPSVDYDKETEELVKLRDELKSISDFVNAPAGPTFAELVDEEMKKLDDRIAELQKTLDEKKFDPKEDQTLYTQELQAKRDERDRLSKLVSKARKQALGDPRTQDEIDRAAIKDARDAIADLERKIKEKDFTRPERRTPTETAEYKSLTEEKERLQKILRDERLKAEGRQGPTDEQRIKQATEAIDASIARMEKMISSGNIDAVKRVSKTPETPELAQKRETRKNLRKQLLKLRKLKRDALIDPIAKQIATDKKRIQTRMDKLKKRMADGDFSKPVKRQKAVDKELLDLQVEEEKLKEEWAKMVFERQLASRGPGKKILDTAQQTVNTARAILTSVDVSAVLRQGGFIVLGNPLRGLRNLGPMFQAFGSEEFARQEKFRLENRENFKNGLYQQSKLFLSDTGKVNQMNKQEEQFMTRWLEKIPRALGGGILRGSQRAYTVFLNRLRADTFDAMVGNLKKGAEPTPEESKTVADYINIATGRGDLGKFSQAGTMLNTVFFAPRLVASRFQILAGYPYFTASGRTKALVLREYAKFLTGASVVYALGMLAQGEDDEPIETDPRSSDFGKIRFGDTRVDPMSGLIQATVLLSRLATGEKKTSKGEILAIRGDKVPYGADTSFDVLANFARTKLSPIVGSAVNVLEGKNVVGEPTDVSEEMLRMVVPMSFTEMKETFEAQGVPEGTALTILQLFGMGVQTYTPGKK